LPSSASPSERRCIVSGQSHPTAGLIRFVAAPDGRLVPDIAGALPGRGIWVSAERTAVETAQARRLFARAARQAVELPDDMAAQVEQQLAQSCLNLLGLARRAGEIVTGYQQVAAALAAGEVAAVVTASDAKRHGKQKIAAKTKGYEVAAPIIELFDGGELSLALGRENVVHAALRPGGLATRFLAECARLAGFRP